MSHLFFLRNAMPPIGLHDLSIIAHHLALGAGETQFPVNALAETTPHIAM
jgi:hypothetical protein